MLNRRCAVFIAGVVMLAVGPSCNKESSGFIRAVFDLSRTSQDLYAIPYPNDIRLQPDGTLDLAGAANEHRDLIKLYLETVAENRVGGFASGGAIHLQFDGPVDTESCAPQTPRDSLLPGSSIYLVNIDKGSLEYGQRIPLRWRYTAAQQKYIGGHSLTLLPERGFVLAADTTYAAVVTEALCDRLGDPVQPNRDFELLLATTPPDGAAYRAAHTAYAPLRAYLDQHGLTGLVVATVFTTGDSTMLAGRARQVVYSTPVPDAMDLVVAEEKEPYFVLEGKYQAPNFQTGQPPYLQPADGGVFKLDASGKPIPQRTETLRFALSVPKGDMPPDGWPVVLYAHGTGGSYRTFVGNGVAKALSAVRDDSGKIVSRLAVIGIDQVLHGPRAPAGSAPDLTFFNLQNPAAAVHNVIQAGVDDFSLLRMVKQVSVDRAPWEESSGNKGLVRFEPPVKFDPKRIFFMGHSQGGLTGGVFLAHEPEIKTAVLSGAGGGAVLGLLEKSAPITIKPLLATALGETPDEYHPMMTLVQQMLEAADTANYGRRMLRDRHQGVGPKNIFLSQGFVDHYTPNEATDALAVAIGLPLAGAVVRDIPSLALTDLPSNGQAVLPLAGNLQVGDEAVTGALLQYRAKLHKKTCSKDSDCKSGDYCVASEGRCADDGHFVMFGRTDAIRQYSLFLATAARDGVAVIPK